MKCWNLGILLLALLLVLDSTLAHQKHGKHKKYRPHSHHKTPPVEEEPQVMPEIHHIEELVEAPLDDWTQMHRNIGIMSNNVPLVDPCFHLHCEAGKVCRLSDEGEAQCVCIPSCPLEDDPRRKVCTNHNETWGSDCAVYQMQCYCEEGSAKCTKEHYKHIQIDYYGQCREMPECQEEEMNDFPRRMRDWLYNIMRDMADREELSPHYLKLEREAETNLTRRWVNAAIWKWCDLDGQPPDRSISRHELFPIRAPLMALEHCIAPFLNSCDPDDNHRITLSEWAKCLELNEEDLEDQCEEVRHDIEE